MNLLRACVLGAIGSLVLSSCGLFGPAKPYRQGDDQDEPLYLDRDYPEAQPEEKSASHKPIDYLLPWRLARQD